MTTSASPDLAGWLIRSSIPVCARQRCGDTMSSHWVTRGSRWVILSRPRDPQREGTLRMPAHLCHRVAHVGRRLTQALRRRLAVAAPAPAPGEGTLADRVRSRPTRVVANAPRPRNRASSGGASTARVAPRPIGRSACCWLVAAASGIRPCCSSSWRRCCAGTASRLPRSADVPSPGGRSSPGIASCCSPAASSP
jgi:hypothetical protein